MRVKMRITWTQSACYAADVCVSVPAGVQNIPAHLNATRDNWFEDVVLRLSNKRCACRHREEIEHQELLSIDDIEVVTKDES